MRVSRSKFLAAIIAAAISFLWGAPARGQVNAEQVMAIGCNVLSMEDYMLSIQYFNQAIKAKPYLADPYYYRALAKLSLEDYKGAEEDCTLAIERNRYKTESYKVRGFARQYLGKDSLAVEDYDIGLSYNPRDKYFLFYKGVALTELDRREEADSTLATLLRLYPRFDDGYTARARLRLIEGDTIAAVADLDRAVEISPNSIRAYLMRAETSFGARKWEQALADMDAAIRLEPREADLYVNRAFVRYNLDDWFGAMADYNYALDLDPLDRRALFNRALLRYEVKDLDRAADDFAGVLRLEPDNFHARFNLGLVDLERGQPADALKQFDAIAGKYPRFYPIYYARAEAYRDMGNMRAALTEAHRGDLLVKNYVTDPDHNPLDRPTISPGKSNSTPAAGNRNSEEPDTLVMERFNELVTVAATGRPTLSFNERIRGRVQDRETSVEPEPSYTLSFIESPASLRSASNYFRELDDLNSRRYIREKIHLSPAAAGYSDQETLDRLFALADRYSAICSDPAARPVDFVALGLAKAMLKDYPAAETAFSRAIELSPDFTVAFMGRGAMRQAQNDPVKAAAAIDDYNAALRINPRLIYARFNIGNIHYGRGDFTSAIDAYSEAIATDPSFGQAYFNRGLAYLRLGNKPHAFADLSKAGELGVIPAYSLLKKMK